MILYHGSNTEIQQVDLSKCRPYKDFGQGFYLTTIYDQAQKMAKRVAKIYGGIPTVTEYYFDESITANSQLQTKTFEAPTEEWALFVINNRNKDLQNIACPECNHDQKYDMVVGPIANDDLALLFRQFSNGLIDVGILVQQMKYKKLTNQYSFHSEHALAYLSKAGAHHE